MSSIPAMTRAALLEAIHASFKDPACVRSGALHIEIHLGQKQAAELFVDPKQMKWPAYYRGQVIYLIEKNEHFAVVPKGSINKQQQTA